MYCLVERGREIETKYKLIDKVLSVLVDKTFIDVLTSNKGLLKGKVFDSIAMEYLFLFRLCEMINFVEHLKEPVLQSINTTSEKLFLIVENFN